MFKTNALSKIDETFSPAALELIANWIVQRARPPRPPEDG
jgi:hypothetical protein